MKRQLVCLAAGAASMGLASAQDTSFCNIDEGSCVKAHLENVSSATITSTKVTQEAGKFGALA